MKGDETKLHKAATTPRIPFPSFLIPPPPSSLFQRCFPALSNKSIKEGVGESARVSNEGGTVVTCLQWPCNPGGRHIRPETWLLSSKGLNAFLEEARCYLSCANKIIHYESCFSLGAQQHHYAVKVNRMCPGLKMCLLHPKEAALHPSLVLSVRWSVPV